MSRDHRAEPIPFPATSRFAAVEPNPAVAEVDLVSLARELAELIPMPSERLARDSFARRAFEEFTSDVVAGLAAAAGDDHLRLVEAIGPRIEVGANPAWRMLLEAALTRVTGAAPVLIAL